MHSLAQKNLKPQCKRDMGALSFTKTVFYCKMCFFLQDAFVCKFCFLFILILTLFLCHPFSKASFDWSQGTLAHISTHTWGWPRCLHLSRVTGNRGVPPGVTQARHLVAVWSINSSRKSSQTTIPPSSGEMPALQRIPLIPVVVFSTCWRPDSSKQRWYISKHQFGEGIKTSWKRLYIQPCSWPMASC